MKAFLLLPLLAVLSSCASDTGKENKSPAAESSRHTLEQRLSEKNGYKQDANGNWVPQTDRRSSFESQGESPYFKGNLAKREYHAGDYAKKSWTGNSRLLAKDYQGKTDGSRFQFLNRSARKGAREASRQADTPGSYQTDDYATGAAREGDRRISKQSDTETDERRKLFTPPAVVDWQEQRSMSVDESKSILGR